MRLTFDHLIFGYFAGDDLIYVKRTRNGFTSAVRRKLFERCEWLGPVVPTRNVVSGALIEVAFGVE
jgi:hypothetical protein